MENNRPTSVVPFFGWSKSAAAFRAVAEEHAPASNVSVLFLGQEGVGKNMMARAWRAIAKEPEKLTFVNLDKLDDNAPLPDPCFAVSTRGLPPDFLCTRLGHCRKAKLAANLPPRLAQHFPRRYYMPPLTERPIDILALLYYFNESGQLGRRFEHIRVRLLERLFSSNWEIGGNGDGLLRHLVAVARNTAMECSTLDRIYSLTLEAKNCEVDSISFLTATNVLYREKLNDAENVRDWLTYDIPLSQLPLIGIDYHYNRLHDSARHCIARLRSQPEQIFKRLLCKAALPDVDTFRRLRLTPEYENRLLEQWTNAWGDQIGWKLIENRRHKTFQPPKELFTVSLSCIFRPRGMADLRALQEGLEVTPDMVANLPDPFEVRAENCSMTKAQFSTFPSERQETVSLETPGIVIYRGHSVRLSGKPRQVLAVLSKARNRTCTASELRNQVWEDNAYTEEATIRSAVSKVRKALCEVLRKANIKLPRDFDPIPTVDRGSSRLAWKLELP